MVLGAHEGTPVLVTAFNRPHLLESLLDRLRSSGVTRLYVSLDGPRTGNTLDSAGVERCVALANEITWAREVKVHVNSINQGCGRAVSSALEWFFSCEEAGIVLEDDILPDPTFLHFASTLLKQYRDDERILAISGCCLVPSVEVSDPLRPYRFSRVPHVWGWAAWRHTWAHYQFDMSDWRSLLGASARGHAGVSRGNPLLGFRVRLHQAWKPGHVGCPVGVGGVSVRSVRCDLEHQSDRKPWLWLWSNAHATLNVDTPESRGNPWGVRRSSRCLGSPCRSLGTCSSLSSQVASFAGSSR